MAAEVLSLKSDVSKYTLARTESLISDVLSFYSLDGTETKDDASKILSSSESHSMKTAPISIGSPTSTQYETASSAASLYETASAGPYSAASGAAADRSSSLSFDTATLQPESPQTLDNTDITEGKLKFRYSEKASQFWKNLPIILTLE